MTQENTSIATQETAKERIKRKKKERAAEELLKEQEKTVTTTNNESSTIDASIQETEVLQIYPYSKGKTKWAAQGTVKIKMPHVGIVLRNIVYHISPNHSVKVQPPFRYYSFADQPDKADAYVESIEFLDKPTWKEAVKKVKAAVLEHHKDQLPKIEASSETQ